jgi:hypothetical protein
LGGASITVVLGIVLRKLTVVLDTDKIVFAGLIQLILLLRADNIIRRADNCGHIGNTVLVIANAPERADFSHILTILK